MRLTTLAKKWGVNPGTLTKYLFLYPEESKKFVSIKKEGKKFRYDVTNLESLKNFLEKHGFTIQEGSNA